jgi:hypothetical protein
VNERTKIVIGLTVLFTAICYGALLSFTFFELLQLTWAGGFLLGIILLIPMGSYIAAELLMLTDELGWW